MSTVASRAFLVAAAAAWIWNALPDMPFQPVVVS